MSPVPCYIAAKMLEPLPQPCDEAVIRAGLGSPRRTWNLEARSHAWQPRRWLPSEPASLLQLECLGILHGDKTLLCAAGSGWMASLLLALGARLCLTEPEALHAHRLSASLGTQIPLCRAKPLDGWREAAPFDRICPAEILTEVPATLQSQLAPEGRLVYWLLQPECLELRLDVREGLDIVPERLALMGLESCPEELVALARP